LTANLVAITGLALLVITIELQARSLEEPYLLAKQGEVDSYYRAAVGRFVPGVGRA
jgi:protein-S-isoprenylcysteine O-methyltransferase Ste14